MRIFVSKLKVSQHETILEQSQTKREK